MATMSAFIVSGRPPLRWTIEGEGIAADKHTCMRGVSSPIWEFFLQGFPKPMGVFRGFADFLGVDAFQEWEAIFNLVVCSLLGSHGLANLPGGFLERSGDGGFGDSLNV